MWSPFFSELMDSLEVKEHSVPNQGGERELTGEPNFNAEDSLSIQE